MKLTSQQRLIIFIFKAQKCIYSFLYKNEFDSIFRNNLVKNSYMTGVLFPNDGFNLTFGKDEWKLHNNYVNEQRSIIKANISLSRTNYRHKSPSLQAPQNKYALQLQKVMKRSTNRKIQFDKENISLNNNLKSNSYKNKARRRSSSIFNHYNKLAINLQNNFPHLGEQINNQKSSFQKSKILKKQNGNKLYDLQLKNRLNEIQNSAKSRTDRYHKLFSDHQSSNKNQQTMTLYVHNKNIESKTNRNVIPKSQQIQKSQKLKYNDQMKRIDGLIEKINTRIKYSIKNFS